MTVSLAGRPTAPLSATDKAIPPAAEGRTAEDFLASAPHLSDLATPLFTLTEEALAGNIDALAAWCAARGVGLAPHGKTTMSPVLWRRQIDAGAWGVTVANYPQLRVAIAAGVRHVMVANAVTDPGALAYLAAALDADPGLDVVVWADGPAVVEATAAGYHGTRPLTVLAELGGPGGRTGARTLGAAVAVAEAVAAAPALRLGGVTGYEGALAHDTSDEAIAVVDGYLERLADLHRHLADRGLYPESGELIASAGGSAYFDRVAAVLGPLADDPRTVVLIRAGAYVIHDDGFYTAMTPAARGGDGPPLRSAMTAWARVLSRPEPGLALLEIGKRDVSFDEGLPIVLGVAQRLGGPRRPLAGATITAVNDQHAYLTVAADDPLVPGDIVALGLSHPCTALDKWRTIPVLADFSDDPAVVDLLTTYF